MTIPLWWYALGAPSLPVGPTLPLGPSTFLESPHLRWIVKLWLESSYPLALTNDPLTTAVLGAGPLIVSTEDVTDLPTALAQVTPYDREVLADGPTGYWKMHALAGAATFKNYPTLGSGLDLTATGGFAPVVGPTAGDRGTGALLDGSTQWAGLASDDARLDIRTGSATWVGWAKLGPAAPSCVLYNKAGVAQADGGYLDAGAFVAGRVRGIVHGVVVQSTTVTIHDDVWHLVGLELDRVAAALALFIDGAEVARVSAASLAGLDLNSPVAPTWGSSTGGAAPIEGAIARWAFYPTAIGAERHAALYRAAQWFTQRTAERRLVSTPVVQVIQPEAGVGLDGGTRLDFQLANGDGALDRWFDQEVRGKLVTADLFDRKTGAILTDAFTGELAGFQQQGRIVSCAATARALTAALDVGPRLGVTPVAFPTSQELAA